MNSENPETPSASATGEEPPKKEPPRHVQSVEECQLQLTRVRLVSLMCMRVANGGPAPKVADVKHTEALIPDTFGAHGFKAAVDWSLEFPEDSQKPPIIISGRYEVEFSVGKEIEKMTAHYYARTNSLVLAYPYIRQLVDELTASSLGQNIMTRPLDVPAWVKEAGEKYLEEMAEREEEARQIAPEPEPEVDADVGGAPHVADSHG